MNWLHEGTIVDGVDKMPDGVYGFIYEITTEHGMKYIGKKTLFTVRKRKFGKKESATITDKRKKLYEMVRKEGDWKTYTGSNTDLNEVIKNGTKYTKEILCYAFHKKQLSYLETKELFVRDVLVDDSYLNSNISGKWYRKDVLPLL